MSVDRLNIRPIYTQSRGGWETKGPCKVCRQSFTYNDNLLDDCPLCKEEVCWDCTRKWEFIITSAEDKNEDEKDILEIYNQRVCLNCLADKILPKHVQSICLIRQFINEFDYKDVVSPMSPVRAIEEN